jgi:hypothetical protein
MKYLNCIRVMIFSSVVPVVTAIHCQSSAHTESQMAYDRVGADIHVLAKEVPLVLGDVLRGTDLSGGVAEEIGCSTLPTAQLDVKQGTTVREAMTSFVAENPHYRWAEDTNVVDVMPTVEFSLLNAKISSFELETTDTTTARTVLNELLNLPQVRQRAVELNLKPGLMQGWMESLPTPGFEQRTPTPIRFSLHDVSLQEAFNSVVRVYGHTIWIYDERHCNGERTYVVRASAE